MDQTELRTAGLVIGKLVIFFSIGVNTKDPC